MVDTPISEQGFTGAAMGASATGTRTVADLMFADFMFEAGGQIVLQAAKLRYMSNGQMNAPMVVRVGIGAVRSAGPHHSGAYHPMWAHVPGPDRLPAVDAGRRQGPDEDRAAGQRSGHDAGDEGAVRDQGRSAGGRAPRAVRRRPHRALRQGPDDRVGGPIDASQPRSGRDAGRPGHRLRGDRPPDHPAARREDGGRERRQDAPPADRRRGLGDVRRRRRARAGDERDRVRRTRCAGRPPPHRAGVASARAIAGAHDAGRCSQDRRRRQGSDGGPRAGAVALALSGSRRDRSRCRRRICRRRPRPIPTRRPPPLPRKLSRRPCRLRRAASRSPCRSAT